jgi:hypothetical protein
MTPMLARSATAAQATFEPDDGEDDDEPDDGEDEEDEDDEDEDEDDEPLPTFSPGFLSPVPDLSPDDEEDDESELAALSGFLPSDPFDEAAAGSALFWLARLSVR